MKNLVKIISLLVIAFFFSCEKNPLSVDCNECDLDEPITADLDIKVSLPQSSGATIIRVYIGNIEDNVLDRSFPTSNDNTSITVTINIKYTITAEYKRNGKIYITVDSVMPGVTYIKDQCTDPCYYTYDKDVDLRLKYTK